MGTPLIISAKTHGHRKAQFGDRVELHTCMDLIDRGYAPFRSVCAHAPFDVIAVGPDAITHRIECRAGQYNPATDRLTWNHKGADVCDWFAVWHPVTGTIHYFTTTDVEIQP